MSNHAWDPKFEGMLQKDIATLLTDPRLQALDATKKQRLRGVNDAIEDVSCITLIYLDGFSEVVAGGPLTTAVGNHVVEWVKRIDPRKSGTRLAGIMASNMCSILEDFIIDEGTDRMTKDAIIVGALTAKRGLHKDPVVAKGQILKAIAPTVKADGEKWLRMIEDVFSVKLPVQVTDSIIPMIAFRNEFVHDASAALQQTKTGEEMTGWALATHVTAYSIAYA